MFPTWMQLTKKLLPPEASPSASLPTRCTATATAPSKTQPGTNGGSPRTKKTYRLKRWSGAWRSIIQLNRALKFAPLNRGRELPLPARLALRQVSDPHHHGDEVSLAAGHRRPQLAKTELPIYARLLHIPGDHDGVVVARVLVQAEHQAGHHQSPAVRRLDRQQSNLDQSAQCLEQLRMGELFGHRERRLIVEGDHAHHP